MNAVAHAVIDGTVAALSGWRWPHCSENRRRGLGLAPFLKERRQRRLSSTIR